MKFEGLPERMALRDGTQVIIRLMEPEDGPALLEFFRALPEEDRLFLRDDVTKPEWLKRYLGGIDYVGEIPLVAESDEVLVGNATLYRTLYGWTVHVAQIRVAVARPFQRKGLGTAMAMALVRIAVNSGIEKMVAEVVDNQIGARRAFEKLGFQPEAVLKGHVKDIHGIRRDLIVLSNDVTHIWRSLEALMADFSPSAE